MSNDAFHDSFVVFTCTEGSPTRKLKHAIDAYLRACPAYRAGMEAAAKIAEDGYGPNEEVHGRDVAATIRLRALEISPDA